MDIFPSTIPVGFFDESLPYPDIALNAYIVEIQDNNSWHNIYLQNGKYCDCAYTCYGNPKSGWLNLKIQNYKGGNTEEYGKPFLEKKYPNYSRKKKPTPKQPIQRQTCNVHTDNADEEQYIFEISTKLEYWESKFFAYPLLSKYPSYFDKKNVPVDTTSFRETVHYFPEVRKELPAVAIPMRSCLMEDFNKIVGIAYISMDEGFKAFEKDSILKASCIFFNTDSLWKDDRIYICEGVANALTIAEITRQITVACFTCNNLSFVATNLKFNPQFKDKHFIFCADNDDPDPKGVNVGVKKATDAADLVGGEVIIPPKIKSRATDINDLLVAGDFKSLNFLLNKQSEVKI